MLDLIFSSSWDEMSIRILVIASLSDGSIQFVDLINNISSFLDEPSVLLDFVISRPLYRLDKIL